MAAGVVWMNGKGKDFWIIWMRKGWFVHLVGRSKEEEEGGGRKVEVKRKRVYGETQRRKPLKIMETKIT